MKIFKFFKKRKAKKQIYFLDYKLMSIKETKCKYAGVNFNKVELVPNPCFLYNIDEEKIIRSNHEEYGIFGKGKNKILKLKPGNRAVCVKTYSEIDPEKLNESKKIFIYPHDTTRFRFILREEIN